MRFKLGARIVFAVIVLILFGVYIYFWAANSPHSDDVGTAVTEPPQTVDEPQTETSPEPTATPEPTLDPNSPAGRADALGLPEPPQVDVTSWEFVLVNPTHSVGADFAPPEIASVSDSACPQDARIADALLAFAQGCKDAGYSVYLSSGYRSYNEQSTNYNNKVAQVGAEKAATIVAPPGTSEHQTGLCCDITDVYRHPKDPDVLAYTDTFIWLNEHCAEYGFILRYPEDKTEITGIMYEPWHFRYVGVEAATYMKDNGLCLEEFLALYGVE